MSTSGSYNKPQIDYPFDFVEETGPDPVASTTGSLIIGYGATDADDIGTNTESRAVVIGDDANALLGVRNVIIGAGAQGGAGTNTGNGSVTIGSNTSGVGQHAVAIGAESAVQGGWGIAIGSQAMAGNSDPDPQVGQYATAIGRGAMATVRESTAIGHNAVCSHNKSLAIGNTSVTTREEEFSIGGGTIATRFLANVKDPVLPNDAVNLQTLDNRLSSSARTAIDALTPIPDPATATIQDVAIAYNNLLAALQS